MAPPLTLLYTTIFPSLSRDTAPGAAQSSRRGPGFEATVQGNSWVLKYSGEEKVPNQIYTVYSLVLSNPA
jgi:hypothetical protein